MLNLVTVQVQRLRCELANRVQVGRQGSYHVVSVDEEAAGTLLMGGYTARGERRTPFVLRCRQDGKVLTRFELPA